MTSCSASPPWPPRSPGRGRRRRSGRGSRARSRSRPVRPASADGPRPRCRKSPSPSARPRTPAGPSWPPRPRPPTPSPRSRPAPLQPPVPSLEPLESRAGPLGGAAEGVEAAGWECLFLAAGPSVLGGVQLTQGSEMPRLFRRRLMNSGRTGERTSGKGPNKMPPMPISASREQQEGHPVMGRSGMRLRQRQPFPAPADDHPGSFHCECIRGTVLSV